MIIVWQYVFFFEQVGKQFIQMDAHYTGSMLCDSRSDFINRHTGGPAKNSSYDIHRDKLCDEAGIERFWMHALRHTYATLAIERRMQPKMLQKLPGITQALKLPWIVRTILLPGLFA